MPTMAYVITGRTHTGKKYGRGSFPAVIENRDECLAVPCNMDKIIHDFHSSLNVIVGYAELMLDGVLGEVNEEQHTGLEDILRSSQKLQGLIDCIVSARAASGDKQR